MPKLDKLSIANFAKQLGSDSPAPGGGSTAALAGAMASSLIGMAARITLKRNKTLSTVKKRRLEEIISESDTSCSQFLNLINDDTEAFNEIIKSYKLPKSSDKEKKKRLNEIQQATKYAAEVPLSTAKLGLKTLNLIKKLLKFSTDQVITDLGVAGLTAYSAVVGAAWNVRINLSSIKDEKFIQMKSKEVDEILKETTSSWDTINQAVENKL